MIDQLDSKQTAPTLSGATTLLRQAWSIYKKRLGTFLGIIIIPILIMMTLPDILTGNGFLGSIPLLSKLTTGNTGLLIILAILYFVIIFAIYAWGQTALIYAIKDSKEGIGVIESYRRGWHKILSYWWILLLIGFITFGGLMLLIVPGIIFAVWFSFAIFILIAEDTKGMNALLKSREYVKGKWGDIVWRLFFIGVVSFIIALVPIVIFTFVKIPFGNVINNFIIRLFLTPLIITYGFLVYDNLRGIKGKITFEQTLGKKAPFIIVGIIGILPPAFMLLEAFLLLANPI